MMQCNEGLEASDSDSQAKPLAAVGDRKYAEVVLPWLSV